MRQTDRERERHTHTHTHTQVSERGELHLKLSGSITMKSESGKQPATLDIQRTTCPLPAPIGPAVNTIYLDKAEEKGEEEEEEKRGGGG
jgi:hypothetical protein